MSSAFTTESLAGTGRTYIQGQMTSVGYGDQLHFQVWAPEAEGSNRPYGLAFNTSRPEVAEQALEAGDQNALSLVTDKRYTVVRIKPVPGGIHVQVAGDQVNRRYGAAFDVSAPSGIVQALREIRASS